MPARSSARSRWLLPGATGEDFVIHSDLSGEATVAVTRSTAGRCWTNTTRSDGVHRGQHPQALRQGQRREAAGIHPHRRAAPGGDVSCDVQLPGEAFRGGEGEIAAQILVGQFTVSKDGPYTVVERKLSTGTPTMSLPLGQERTVQNSFRHAGGSRAHGLWFSTSHTGICATAGRWPTSRRSSPRW